MCVWMDVPIGWLLAVCVCVWGGGGICTQATQVHPGASGVQHRSASARTRKAWLSQRADVRRAAAARTHALTGHAATSLHALHALQVDTHLSGLTPATAQGLVGAYDVVLDCSDNPATRYLIRSGAGRGGAGRCTPSSTRGGTCTHQQRLLRDLP